MAKIDFPRHLKQLLEDSDLEAPIRVLADRVGEILADNKLVFFPDYTDHGTDHINRVLRSEVDLVPKQVWEGSKRESEPRLLCDADSAVLIGATLLHDIAMHLHPAGFLELVGKESRFRPLPWFKDSHEGHSSDRPWNELWEDYVREARRFSDRHLSDIIGEPSSLVWKFQDLPLDPGQWERNHCLIIGEFIRRHHSRLAHEIAIYGFPGVPVGSGEDQFPAMGREEGHTLARLADLIGLTARSHGMNLRVCKAYLDSSPRHHGTPRPMGTAVLYPMALLRVADYLQLDRQRAPAALLQLRNPQSPISVQEWRKHLAVDFVGPATNPRGKMVTVSTDLSLPVYLQLRDLLARLQEEMDHSTSVLDEAYGTLTELGLNQLSLAARRVHSNLQSSVFRDNLPYVPQRTGFSADPHLLTLLVEPLYGKQPAVGVRELVQNAVDAVRELEAWCKARDVRVNSLDLPKQDSEVLVTFTKREDGSWFLRVQDKGIGMRADTIQNYFLRAGASFRRDVGCAESFLDKNGQPCAIRAGRFGIGAFAIFLLGPSFWMWTRHVGADSSAGYVLEASAGSQLIEIRRVGDLCVGTTIEAEMSRESVEAIGLEGENYASSDELAVETDWFCWDWPMVVRCVDKGGNKNNLVQRYRSPIRATTTPFEWSVIHPEGFDALYWTFGDAPRISCNGFIIARPQEIDLPRQGAQFYWPEEAQLACPCIAVLDSQSNLPLTIQRYQLSNEVLPFVDCLSRDVMLSFIAHSLICGPASRMEALSFSPVHPLLPEPFSKNDAQENPFMLRWCSSASEVVPADPWLCALLGSKSYLMYGALDFRENLPIAGFVDVALLSAADAAQIAILPWNSHIQNQEEVEVGSKEEDFAARALKHLVSPGLGPFGQIESSLVIVSSRGRVQYMDDMGYPVYELTGAMRRQPWEDVNRDINFYRPCVEARKGSHIAAIPLLPLLAAMEKALKDEDILFVAEIKTKSEGRAPESLISKLWFECLGTRAIPFDPAAREALISDACKHLELKRHIDAWKEMKHTRSKWVAQGKPRHSAQARGKVPCE